MRFVCPELGGDLIQLYRASAIEQTSILEPSGLTLTPDRRLWRAGSAGLLWHYSTAAVAALQSSLAVAPTGMTMAQYAAALDVTLTTNLSITATTFDWPRSPGSVIASYWYTILSETGLHFVRPVRRTGAAQIVGDVVSRETGRKVDLAYSGVSGGDYRVGTGGDTVQPTVIDATLKGLALNKEKSRADAIEIASAMDAAPLDWYNDGGLVYVLISRREEAEGRYIYTAVRETDEAWSGTGSDIPCPSDAVRLGLIETQLTDEGWQYVGTAGKPAFANSWTNFGASNQSCAYRRVKICGLSAIQIVGDISSGTISSTTPTTVFTLPSGYRPGKTSVHTGMGVHSNSVLYPMRIEVTSGGLVQVAGSTNVRVGVGCITVWI